MKSTWRITQRSNTWIRTHRIRHTKERVMKAANFASGIALLIACAVWAISTFHYIATLTA